MSGSELWWWAAGVAAAVCLIWWWSTSARRMRAQIGGPEARPEGDAPRRAGGPDTGGDDPTAETDDGGNR